MHAMLYVVGFRCGGVQQACANFATRMLLNKPSAAAETRHTVRLLRRRLYVLHAHTYFPYSTDSDKAKASKFRAAVQSQFEGVQAVKISDISPEAVGPHPMPEFELAFTKPCLEKILPWLIFNRPEDYSILVHPFTSDVVSITVIAARAQHACSILQREVALCSPCALTALMLL